MSQQQQLAILVGGGPAPGINSVIASATIRAILEGVEVIGIRDGFEWIMKGDTSHVTPLTTQEISRIHFSGGSHIGISRANPTKVPKHLETAVESLLRLNVSQLITIGGDDTAYSAMRLEQTTAGRLQIVHVPKTIDIGDLLKDAVRARLKKLGIEMTIASKDIGYELRCADPIPFDLEYTRDLGYCATKYLLSGGNAAMISMQAGNVVPVPFRDLIDPVTGRAKIRMVDIRSTRYAIARRYMIRLRRDDFEEPLKLAKIAETARMSVSDFRKEFEYLIETELPPIVFGVEI